MYSGAQGERQIPQKARLLQGEKRTASGPQPIVIIASENVASLVAYILEEEGHLTIAAHDISRGAALAQKHEACLILLDTDVLDQREPKHSAIEPLITNATSPLLILTPDSEHWNSLVRPALSVRVVQKPLPTLALLTAIRTQMAAAGRVGELQFADVRASLRTRGIRRGARRVHTSPTQFRMLCHLLRYPGKVISREELIEAVWKRNAGIDRRTVDAHIVRLRKALTCAGEPNLIQTVRSAGYLLDSDN